MNTYLIMDGQNTIHKIKADMFYIENGIVLFVNEIKSEDGTKISYPPQHAIPDKYLIINKEGLEL